MNQLNPLSRFKWVRIAAVLMVLVVGLAAAWWFLWVPEHRPALDQAAGEVHAIDVSNHQGVIDWSAVADDGIGAGML
ncbi:MAG: hypothetical protein L0I80_04485 [Brevibacterium sp.]|nr:hypothetical protein [Brevibacterium sp.]